MRFKFLVGEVYVYVESIKGDFGVFVVSDGIYKFYCVYVRGLS